MMENGFVCSTSQVALFFNSVGLISRFAENMNHETISWSMKQIFPEKSLMSNDRNRLSSSRPVLWMEWVSPLNCFNYNVIKYDIIPLKIKNKKRKRDIDFLIHWVEKKKKKKTLLILIKKKKNRNSKTWQNWLGVVWYPPKKEHCLCWSQLTHWFYGPTRNILGSSLPGKSLNYSMGPKEIYWFPGKSSKYIGFQGVHELIWVGFVPNSWPIRPNQVNFLDSPPTGKVVGLDWLDTHQVVVDLGRSSRRGNLVGIPS